MVRRMGSASFVLVHGAAHGAWCWERVVPHLQASPAVDAVVAIDLVGHGARLEEKPLDSIRLDDYADDVVREVETRDLQDVVLVGHSMAGITLPLAAPRIQTRLRRLIYLSTANPPLGQSINDLMTDPLSPVSRELDFETMFCNDLDDEDTAWLLNQLGPEPPGPMAEAARVSPRSAGIESTYVLLEQDEALLPAFQREQIHNVQPDEVVSFDAGHSAFASRPEDLADLFLRCARP